MTACFQIDNLTPSEGAETHRDGMTATDRSEGREEREITTRMGAGDVLPTLLGTWARQTPDRVFLEEIDGPSLTYAQTNDAVLRWAAALQRVGVVAGDRVLTMLPTSALASCAWLGIAALRAIEVPCNAAYRGRMLGYLASNSAAATVIIAAPYVEQFAGVAADLASVRTIVVVGGEAPQLAGGIRVISEEEFLAGVEPATDLPPAQPSDICALFYTSGTTGPSKGVLVPWGQLHQSAYATSNLGLTEQDAFYVPYPGHHLAGKTPLYSSVLAHARVVIRERFDTKSFWKDIDDYRCTWALLLGAMQSFLWRQEPRDDDSQHALRNVMMYPVLPEVDEFKRRFGVRVGTSYGSTEQGPAIHAGWNTSSATSKSCGRLRPGYPGWEARVVDEQDNELGPGEIGELVVRTSAPWTINQGYFGMPEKTVEAWRNGWFHTGDAFTCDADGNFYFVDRVRDCIRRRGENISSFEVEVEVNAHPLIVESAVVGVPSEHGEEDVKVLAVTKEGETLDPQELIEFLTPRLPRFMIPRYVQFVAEIPKTEATHRVKKYLLREDALSDDTWDRDTATSRVPA